MIDMEVLTRFAKTPTTQPRYPSYLSTDPTVLRMSVKVNAESGERERGFRRR